MDQTGSTSELEPLPPRTRKRSRWLLAATVVLVIAALALTPPLINVNRYRRRIAATMGQSLGRPVHLDNVSLHLLPLPGFTLQNLVVSEDPAFGYEPVIRANTVQVTLRASSLWRRRVEFSNVRFIDPSVNIVRNAEGRWNLEDILLQASRVEAAPTGQRKAGPAPRFPYIEATGARVNVKFGSEKMPYSLTDADFALWLPSPQQWRVRLQGKPVRTDINVSEAGLLLVQGSLHRSDAVAGVPVDLHASWRGAPLGEASRLITGEDAGWRGTLFLELSLIGQVSNAALTTHLQLNDLRRADFVPAKALDVTVDCAAASNILRASLGNARCVVPVEKTAPLSLTAATVDLLHPGASAATAQVDALPLPWAMDWARLFSPRIPPDIEPNGTLAGTLDWKPAAATWQGRLIATLPSLTQENSSRTAELQAGATVFNFDIGTPAAATGGVYPAPWVKLGPVALHATPPAAFTLSGQADANGYGLQLVGNGTGAQVRSLAGTFPPFNEGVDTALGTSEGADAPRPISLTCSRLWGGTQTCGPLVQPEPPRPSRPVRRHHHRP